MSELKPCPFCGCLDIDEKAVASDCEQATGCMICGAAAGLYPTKEQAIKAWNTRRPTITEESILDFIGGRRTVDDIAERLFELYEGKKKSSEIWEQAKALTDHLKEEL